MDKLNFTRHFDFQSWDHKNITLTRGLFPFRHLEVAPTLLYELRSNDFASIFLEVEMLDFLSENKVKTGRWRHGRFLGNVHQSQLRVEFCKLSNFPFPSNQINLWLNVCYGQCSDWSIFWRLIWIYRLTTNWPIKPLSVIFLKSQFNLIGSEWKITRFALSKQTSKAKKTFQKSRQIKFICFISSTSSELNHKNVNEDFKC